LHGTTEGGESAELELARERIEVTVDRQYASTKLAQVYINRSGERVEGQYQLQAGEGAEVHGFAYYNGEQRIVGEVFEHDVATDIYEEITGFGRDPGLLEQTGEGAFSFRVFPIEPEERKRVEVEYHQWLDRTSDQISLRIPLAAETPELFVNISDDRHIDGFSSSTHEFQLNRVDDDHVKIELGTAKTKDAEEFVLQYGVAMGPLVLDSAVHRDAGHDGYLQLTMAAPKVAPMSKAMGKDVTLVIDVSGSMDGAPIEQAKLAAVDVLNRLPTEDRVNVVLFDDSVDQLFNRPEPVDAAHRREAIAFVRKADGGGGTDLALALERALAAQVRDDQPDVILFLTDGQSDTQKTLEVAKHDRGDARVYTIGVGDGVERPLLSRLASTKRGKFTFIERPEAITDKMSKLYDQIEEPVLVDLEIEVEGATVTQMYPQSLPDLYAADELRLAARVRGTGATKIVVSGMQNGKRVKFEHELDVPETARRPWVGRMWAESRVDDLLEEIALDGETAELRQETVELALAYDVVTPYTAFLAIPESELTENASETLAQARKRKEAILAANADAAALSRSAMPPGDPVLSVRAPANARQVTARFEFGLVKDLEWDPDQEMWTTRFLVPKGVSDGDYDVEVVVVDKFGAVTMSTVQYTIDATDPGFEVETEVTPEGVKITVRSEEKLREAWVAVVDREHERIALQNTGNRLTFTATLPLTVGVHDLVVLVADEARNESLTQAKVEVK
jgi:Ca-activated chloride channel family protein